MQQIITKKLMSNKKQTAVDWFFSELERMQYFIGNDMLQAYKDAKEMDEQQKIEDYRAGRTAVSYTHLTLPTKRIV